MGGRGGRKGNNLCNPLQLQCCVLEMRVGGRVGGRVGRRVGGRVGGGGRRYLNLFSC